MRKVLIAAVCSSALAACGSQGFKISKHVDIDDDDDKAMVAVTQLVCPDHQDDLTRVRTSPDGTSCDYAGPRGAQVTLSLIKVKAGEDSEAALKPLETQLAGLMPTAMAKLAKDKEKAEGDAEKAQADADKASAQAEAASDAADEAADRAAEAADKARDAASDRGDESAEVKMPGVSVKSRGDSANVRLPGIRVDANDSGAHINIAGIHIDADGHKGGRHSGSGTVNITGDNNDVSIHAEDHAAEIRARHKGQGLRMTYVLANDVAETAGWRLVGYEARGPASGPLVVAVVRSKDRHEDPIFHAAKALVKKNVEK
jgi:hypothetical protein